MSVEKDELEAKNYTALDTINLRKSTTAFMQDSIADDTKIWIDETVFDYNEKVGTFRWVVSFDEMVPLKPKEKFKNVDNCIYLIGKKDSTSNEQTGFYGQMLLLKLMSKGIQGSFITDEVLPLEEYNKFFKLKRNEILYGIIIFGYKPKKMFFFTEKETYTKNKISVDSMITLNRLAPEWFMFGAYAMTLAPSYRNRQPVRMSYIDFKLSIYVKGSFNYMKQMDLGCAKANFTFLTDIVVTTGNYGTLLGDNEEVKLPNKFISKIKQLFGKKSVIVKSRREIERENYRKRDLMDDDFFDSHSYIAGDYERLNVKKEVPVIPEVPEFKTDSYDVEQDPTNNYEDNLVGVEEKETIKDAPVDNKEKNKSSLELESDLENFLDKKENTEIDKTLDLDEEPKEELEVSNEEAEDKSKDL